jgi:hypothetical protein
MPVLRIHFVGGPFDGAFMDVPVESDLPTCWFLSRADADDMRGAFVLRFGLIASLLPNAWSERYILSAREAAEATYLHESIHAGRSQRQREAAA